MRLAMALSLLFAVLFVGPSAAQSSRSLSWERFDVTMELLPDSTLRVTETQQVRFDGTHQWLDREIPLGRLSSVTEVQVSEMGRAYTQGYNRPDTFAVGRSEDRLRIDWWFAPATNSTRTFELHYRVSGAIRVYEGGDELFWTAVPAGRQAEVRASEVVVKLPAELSTGQVGASAGPGGLPANGPGSVGPHELHFTASDLPPEQGYQIRLELPHGVVAARPPAWQSAYDRQVWLDSLLPSTSVVLGLTAAMIFGGGLLLVFGRWRPRTSGRADVMPSVEEEMPPSGLPPAVVGMLIDGRADGQDALATLMVLAHRGVIRFGKERESSQLRSEPDYKLELLREQPLGLRTYEKTLIGALFGSDREVRLSQAKARWAPNMWLFQSQVQEEAVRAGLLSENRGLRPVRGWTVALATISGAAVLALLAGLVLGPAAELLWLAVLALALAGLMFVIAVRRGPGRTRAGAAEAARWQAFGRHFSSPRQQSEAANPEKLVRELPYAVALGVIGQASPEHVGALMESTAAVDGPHAAPKGDGLYEMLEAASEALSGGGDPRR
jgi:uncharacterized protein (TIGR04222 family)